MQIASGKDLVVVGLVDVTSALHTFLVPQIESHLVLGIVAPSPLVGSTRCPRTRICTDNVHRLDACCPLLRWVSTGVLILVDRCAL